MARKLGDDFHGWVSDGIREGGEVLTMDLGEEKTLSELSLTFHSDFNYPIRVTMAPNRQVQQRKGVPAELVKDYDIVFKRGGETVRTVSVRSNHQRYNPHKFEPVTCDSVDFRFYSTNGSADATVFEVRAYE